MLTSGDRPHLNLQLSKEKKIETVEYNYLGVVLDNKLKWLWTEDIYKKVCWSLSQQVIGLKAGYTLDSLTHRHWENMQTPHRQARAGFQHKIFVLSGDSTNNQAPALLL